MADHKKPSDTDLQKENNALKAELEALRDAYNERGEQVEKAEVPKERTFKIGKKQYVFAPVAECWWNSEKIKVADALKDDNLLKDMVEAGFVLVSKVTK